MTLRISSAQLVVGMQGDDVVRLQGALKALGRDIPVTERGILGPGTSAVLKGLQAELGLTASGAVDAATVRAINARLAQSETEKRFVRGMVRDAEGRPFAKGFVQLYTSASGREQTIGKSPLEPDGSYEISYEPPANTAGRLDLRIDVLNDSGALDTTPSGANILVNAGPLEVVDFLLSGEKNAPRPEFDVLNADLSPLLEGRDPSKLTDTDIGLLASASGHAPDLVTTYVLAQKLKTASAPAAVVYALVKQGLPASSEALSATHGSVRTDAVKAAVAQGVIAPEIDGKKAEDYVPGLTSAPTSALQGLLGRVLNADGLSRFTDQYLKAGGDTGAFWRGVEADPALSSQARELKLTVQLGALTNNHVPLVTALKSTGRIDDASDVAALDETEWKSLIGSAGVPADTPGADADEKLALYTQQILSQVEAAFPTRYFAERLGTSPVADMLKAAPAFDLKTTYPEQFFKSNPALAQGLDAADKGRLRSFQRLHRLTGGAQETLALEAKGFRSASSIARMDRSVFANQNTDVLPAESAAKIHDRAVRTSAIALAIAGEHGAGLNRTTLRALPKLDVRKQAMEAADTIPDWASLFGSFDFCACEECTSAHSPAAYLVDVLKFLGDRGVRASLFARRPDIGDLELSCDNTNITLPVIDLVNEILEDAVAPHAPFSPFPLAAGLEPDLAQALATPALAAAFTPPLSAGAQVEAIEAGKRWRIWDADHAYAIVKDGGALTVAARSRQTMGSASRRRSTPQYRNAAAYDELRQAVYPWALPFDLAEAEASAFLSHLGPSRSDLMEALSPLPGTTAPAGAELRLATARLGLTDIERRILTGEALTPLRQPEEFWGSAQPADLAIAQTLLDRSGLAYAELEEILQTWFVDPDHAIKIAAEAGAPIDTCDTTKLRIEGLDADKLGKLHRFVRLWRRLGWSIAECDKVLFALATGAPAITDQTLIQIDRLRSLATRLRLDISNTLALWHGIDTREPGSLYRKLFYDPVVFRPQDEAFRLRADGLELEHAGSALSEHAGSLQAVFRLNAASLDLLAGMTDGTLSLAHLSLIHRHAVLARQLRLSFNDLRAAIELAGLDPFDVDRMEDAERLADIAKDVAASGYQWSRLDYLLRHRFTTASPFVSTEEELAQQLAALREDLLKVDAPTGAEREALRRGAAVERVSAATGLDASAAAEALERTRHGGETALKKLLRLPDMALPLARSNAQAQFEVLEKLLKAGSVVETSKLPASGISWLAVEGPWLFEAPDPLPTPILLEHWLPIIHAGQVRQDLALDDAALDAVLRAIVAVTGATDPASSALAKQGFQNTLAQWLGWRDADIESLLGKPDDLSDRGILGARFPEDYRIALVARLTRVFGHLKRLGVSAATALEWCGDSVSDAHAQAIRAAAKAKHGEDAWPEIAAPLQDALREKQRDALVAFLLARPETWNPSAERPDANDLFAFFLIDVEMASCQLTSRMKQAMGSVQLFTQRALMGLEANLDTSDPKWTQWTWMKNYRVWEANRKIWLYPENWIEPELRDDKSPFFKELEAELLQSDLDDFTAEQAFVRYLEKLDEVARLEIAGAYEDLEDKTLHVFGRTFNPPYAYFYRRREGATSVWTPWEKAEIDIEGDHLIPVVWNRKLMAIWPIFTEKTLEKPIVMPGPGSALQTADKYWEIQLAWSELQNGRWTGKTLSAPATFIAYQGEDNVLFGPRVNRLQNSAMMRRMNDGDIGSTDPDDNPPPEDPVTPPPPPPSGGGATAPRRLVGRELFSFKGLVFGDNLVVRAYLRRDYRRGSTAEDKQVAYPIGEFRFTGCRKIVTTAPNPQIAKRNYALAPSGTKFDHMWFTQTSSKFTMFDGTFPAFPIRILEDIRSTVNEPAPAGSDPSGTLVNKQNIPVLDQTPWRFRVLAPHQDLWFVGDRPFFYTDTERSFIATSRGASGKKSNPLDWIHADLATVWRAAYFPRTAPSDDPGPAAATAPSTMTALLPGKLGRRVAVKMAPIDLSPAFKLPTLLPTFWTTREYRFENFHHPYVCEFVKTLTRKGLPGLLSLETQSAANPQSFDAYKPQPRVLKAYPIDDVEFRAGRAYDLYNWELFFHIPLLIATRLSANQRFQEAQRWLHYIFDPTGAADGPAPQRYWRTKPFHDRLDSEYEEQSVKSLETLIAEGPSEELAAAVAIWRDNPFSPHAVARLRTTAYQKAVVMKYIDNLVGWGDSLFRADTLETLNEATQLYVLAAEILGRRPEVIARDLKPVVQTFVTLEPKLGALSNALEEIELLVGDAGETEPSPQPPETPDLPSPEVLYFCVPENRKLIGYWDTVADRLFKIRHCMNIEGQVRQLPLFEPPIDPTLLVRARAAGVSLADAIGDLTPSLPGYRFATMQQKAAELTNELRSLGSSLLAILERRDAEALSLLRSGQEIRLLRSVRDIKVHQIADAKTAAASLEQARAMAEARKAFYESRDFLSALEGTALALTAASQIPLGAKAAAEAVSVIVHLLPDAKAGAPTTVGIEFGGKNKGGSSGAFASLKETAAMLLNIAASATSRLAEYDRRQDEWELQASLAAIELKQIDQQLAGADIKLALAEQELRNHDQQADNAAEADAQMRSRFTNQDLYQWTITQVSSLYFQTYRLAYDLAKRAELCMQHELGLAYGSTTFVQFGYWDSLKKGLLAGDRLAFDLKRLDTAYLEGNVREYELTKHVSLSSLAPEQLIALKETGICEFDVPEWLFDLDTPGHFRRRLKMVSLTIPSVTGPYTTVHCKAQLLKSSYRQATDVSQGYARRAPDDPAGSDERFIDDRKILEAIVTSTGQNDAGLFEPTMRDERYLPFEGAGASSRWRLELPVEFRTFDHQTISDVILHLRYTARDGGAALRTAAVASTQQLLSDAAARPLTRLVSLRHEFPSQWQRFVTAPASAMNTATIELGQSRFPYFTQARQITISQARTVVRSRPPGSAVVAIAPGEDPPDVAQPVWTGSTAPGTWTIGTTSDPRTIEDVLVLLSYSLG
ncbi:MAG: neuraminidase-like domain-containing protein [Parvibaculaceae bacterium]